jgi:6-phosphofructokinase 2
MRDILTVTLNPALDLATEVDRIVPNVKLRCAPAVLDPGGGGINVSRAVKILGGSSRCLVVLGGHNGEHMAKLMTEAGLNLIVHPARGETRSSLSVLERATGEQFRFMLPGPEWSPLDVAAVTASVSAAAEPGGLAVISGSIPPGVPLSIPLDLARSLGARGVDVVVDTSGEPLRIMGEATDAAVHVLRMNHTEADELIGRPLRDLKDSADFAQSLVARGVARIVIVARDREGSVLAAGGGLRLHAPAADVPVKSKVGAGDTFVGAFTLALAAGRTLAEALTRGVAAASAAVMTDATRLCRREDAERLIAECAARAI